MLVLLSMQGTGAPPRSAAELSRRAAELDPAWLGIVGAPYEEAAAEEAAGEEAAGEERDAPVATRAIRTGGSR